MDSQCEVIRLHCECIQRCLLVGIILITRMFCDVVVAFAKQLRCGITGGTDITPESPSFGRIYHNMVAVRIKEGYRTVINVYSYISRVKISENIPCLVNLMNNHAYVLGKDQLLLV